MSGSFSTAIYGHRVDVTCRISQALAGQCRPVCAFHPVLRARNRCDVTLHRFSAIRQILIAKSPRLKPLLTLSLLKHSHFVILVSLYHMLRNLLAEQGALSCTYSVCPKHGCTIRMTTMLRCWDISWLYRNLAFSEKAHCRVQVSHGVELPPRVEMRHWADAVFYVSKLDVLNRKRDLLPYFRVKIIPDSRLDWSRRGSRCCARIVLLEMLFRVSIRFVPRRTCAFSEISEVSNWYIGR